MAPHTDAQVVVPDRQVKITVESCQATCPVIRLTIQVEPTKMAMGQQILVVLAGILRRGTFRFHGLEVVFEFLELFRGYDGPVALW